LEIARGSSDHRRCRHAQTIIVEAADTHSGSPLAD
jgi:hypothetical protein